MGVGYAEFWELTPKALYSVSIAYNELINQHMDLLWLQGLYIQYAFGSTQSNKIKYPKEPFHRKKITHINGEITNDHAKNVMDTYMKLINSKNKGGGSD